MSAYYNEIDPQAAAWLRQLIGAKVIPDGEVDERSIEDIHPGDLAGFTQCHFFAGIGGWPEGLRLAGWPDSRGVWTGSCPCQSFSAAGTRTGFADKRHLWPAWFHLIEQCRPPVVFGEQVDAAVKYGWLDLVQADMEAIGYAVGGAIVPAAGVGAPHGRHRLWFVADSDDSRWQRWRASETSDGRIPPRLELERLCDVGDMADASSERRPGFGLRVQPGQSQQDYAEAGRHGEASSLEQPESEQARISRLARERRKTGAFWGAADWIYCRDDKWRPVEPGTFPLAYGLQARVGRLRGYGNALVPQVAEQVIRAYSSGSRRDQHEG